MNMVDFKKEYVGKTIKLIADLKSDGFDAVKREFKIHDYIDGFTVKVIFFEENNAIVFIDEDCDGYRSGDWNVGRVKLICESGLENVKPINSKIYDIEKYTNVDKTGLIIYTDEYVIDMGQDSSDSYYPSNYFSIEEIKKGIIGKGELISLD